MDAKAALTTLTRLASRKPDQTKWLEHFFRNRLEELADAALEVSVETGDPIGQVLAAQLKTQDSAEWTLKLARTCDTEKYAHSFTLWEVAQVVARKALNVYQEVGEQSLSLMELADVARMASNLSQRLLGLGHQEEALYWARDAVRIYRSLTAASPPDLDLLPYFAASLVALGNCLVAQGFLEEGLDVGREALALGQPLHPSASEPWKGLQAAALATLGLAFNKLRRYEEALQVNREAVALSRQMPQLPRDTFVSPPPRAVGLINLAVSLFHLGKGTEAIETAREASSLIRELFHQRQDIFLPLLIESLEQQGVIHSALGEQREALELAREATLACRNLMQTRPTAFRPSYAHCLLSLSSMLQKSGQLERALQVAELAVMQFRLAERYSSGHAPALAQAVSNRSGILFSLGRHQEALEEAWNAVQILQEDAPGGTASYDLGYCLYNLGLMQKSAARLEEAISSIERALAIFRAPSEGRSLFIQSKAPACLRLLGSLHSEAGRDEVALRLTQEAVAMARALVDEYPRTYREELAESLGHLGNRLANVGRLEEGRSAHEEAVCIYRELAAEVPFAFQPSLATGLNNLGADYLSLGLLKESVAIFEEALRLIAPFFLSRPVALVETVSAIVASYVHAAKSSGGDLNLEVLAPICQVLENFLEKDES